MMLNSMRAIGLAGLSILPVFSTAALGESANPFVGRWRWDGPETCAKNYDRDNVALEIEAKKLIFYENSCHIDTLKKLGETSFRLELTCKGEGETERSEIILALLKPSKVNQELLLRIELKSGFVLAYRRCE
jgi:hypothetical protein